MTTPDEQEMAIALLSKPGSDAAVKLGCTCPVMDNAHGRGIGGDGNKYGWWQNAHCPVHVITREGE